MRTAKSRSTLIVVEDADQDIAARPVLALDVIVQPVAVPVTVPKSIGHAPCFGYPPHPFVKSVSDELIIRLMEFCRPGEPGTGCLSFRSAQGLRIITA